MGAKADWNIWTCGGWEVNAETCVSVDHALKGSAGRSRFFYNGDSSILDTRITAQCKMTIGHYANNIGFWLRTNQLNPISNGYVVWFEPTPSSNYWVVRNAYRYNSGAFTMFVNDRYFAVTNPRTAFHKVRVTCQDNAGNVDLIVEHWTGAAWSTVWSYTDSSVNKLTSAGYAGFELYTGVPLGVGAGSFIDDVLIEENI